MKIHKNAKTTPSMRAQIHARHTRGERTGAIAAALGISRQTACKWIRRGASGNADDLQDRSSRDALAAHGIRHKRTRPYTPRTNGKAERFIQTSIREWAYAKPFASSVERTAAMHPWLLDYNTQRTHAALGGKPPISRLVGNNLSRCDKWFPCIILRWKDASPNCLSVSMAQRRYAGMERGADTCWTCRAPGCPLARGEQKIFSRFMARESKACPQPCMAIHNRLSW